MTPAALPLARNCQPLNVPRFSNSGFRIPRSASLRRALGFLALATILMGLACLTACSGVSSGASQTSSPQISGTLAAPNVGVPYTGTLTATGGKPPYAFTVSTGTLPTGLTLSQTAGTITGTPTQTGVFTFTAQVTDSTGSSGSQEFQLTVTTPAAGAIVVTVSPASATITSPGTMQFSALLTNTNNGAVIWSASPGSISSRGLYQAPAVTTSTTATITATSVEDTTQSGTASLTIMPGQTGSVAITTGSLPAVTAGTAYSAALQASGGAAPYTWTLASGTLPTGLTLQSSGLLSGTTVQTGQFNLTIGVADSSSPPQTANQSLVLAVSSAVSSANTAPTTLFGFSSTNTAANDYPTVNYTMQRFWDSPPLQWPSINTAAGVFNFSNLDAALAKGFSSGVTLGLYTLARTPSWATSNPNDTTCNYVTGTGGGNGECDAPSDLNTDGSGTNATWKAWITAIATHVDDPTYLQTHAHIQYWEIWNEPDDQQYWNGTFAQLARLTEDARCIILGSQGGQNVIHESGNGTATPCTATAIDPTAQIVMSSGHATGSSVLTYAQNQLYCSNTSGVPSYELPCPNPANATAAAVDIINFHMKPGNSTGDECPPPTACTPETAMQTYISNIQGILQPAEAAKPLWNGEASYAISGFTGAYTDGDMAASFMPRFYLLNWSLGISGIAWYDWVDLTTEPAEVETAYEQTYDWLAQSELITPCAANGTVWSCTINQSGTQYLILWDASQSCANGSCTTANQTVGSQWLQYQDMTTASTPIAITAGVVPVGIKPIVLQ
jgi:hypothetical protein